VAPEAGTGGAAADDAADESVAVSGWSSAVWSTSDDAVVAAVSSPLQTERHHHVAT